MRYEKNTPRRIGGLVLDTLMLVFVFTFTFSDPKVVDENSKEIFAIGAYDGNGIVFGVDAVQGSILKLLFKVYPSALKSSNFTFHILGTMQGSFIGCLSHVTLYNIFSSDCTINAP